MSIKMLPTVNPIVISCVKKTAQNDRTSCSPRRPIQMGRACAVEPSQRT